MASILLQGEPGSGKTTMACLTALNRPVHVIDVDRKLPAMQNIAPLIQKGDVTYWDLGVALIEESLATRARGLALNKKPSTAPKGWVAFADLCAKLDTDEVAKQAGTWVIDSVTRCADHLKRFIMFSDDKGGAMMSDRNYGAFLIMWEETVTVLVDSAKAQGKDLILTVHERPSDMPGENTKVMKAKDERGVMRREYIGLLDVKIAASLEGQMSTKLHSYFEEAYGLRVDIDAQKNPHFICRVLPDGKRSLRTSYAVTKAEFPPDFRVIWRQ